MIHAVVYSVGKKPLHINKLFILKLYQIFLQKNSFSILYRRSRVVSTTFSPSHSFSRFSLLHICVFSSAVNSGSCCNYCTLQCCVIRKFAFRSFDFTIATRECRANEVTSSFFFAFNITFQQGAVNVFHPIYIAFECQ